MEPVTIMGFIAAGLTSLSLIPQFLTIYRTKETKDISLMMYVMFCIGITLWLLYGISKGDIVIIAANVVTLTFSSAILLMKIKYK